jgi:hypothetical protein
LQVPWERVPASQRAVHAAVLARNGNEAAAREEIAAIQNAKLRPEERKLITP